MSDSAWPFDQARNTASYTQRQILYEGAPILHVTHDLDGEWQFLNGEAARMEDAQIVTLWNLVDRDPTLLELSDLPEGWMAERSSVSEPWRRLLNPWAKEEDVSRGYEKTPPVSGDAFSFHQEHDLSGVHSDRAFTVQTGGSGLSSTGGGTSPCLSVGSITGT